MKTTWNQKQREIRKRARNNARAKARKAHRIGVWGSVANGIERERAAKAAGSGQ